MHFHTLWYITGLLNYIRKKIQKKRARIFFTQCGNMTDFAPFYLMRGNLYKGENSEKVLIDYNNAVKLVEKSMEWPEHLGVGSPYFPDMRLENYIEAMCYEQMGNKNKATKLYESINKFKIENWKKWGSYHYISTIVLRKLGKNEQAKQLLKDWKKAQPSDDIVVQWSVAKFNNSNIKAQEALENIKVESLGIPWNSAGSDNDFPLVLEAMKLIEK